MEMLFHDLKVCNKGILIWLVYMLLLGVSLFG